MPRPRKGATARCCSVSPLAGVPGAALVRRSCFFLNRKVHNMSRLFFSLFGLVALAMFIACGGAGNPPDTVGSDRAASGPLQPNNVPAGNPGDANRSDSTVNGAMQRDNTPVVKVQIAEVKPNEVRGIAEKQNPDEQKDFELAKQQEPAKGRLTQVEFVKLTESFIESYENAHDVIKPVVRVERRMEFQKAFPGGIVTNWIGTVQAVKAKAGEDAVIHVTLEGSVIVSLKNVDTSWGDRFKTGDTLRIQPGSDLHKKAAELSKGDKLLFSGEFIIRNDWNDYILENSYTEKGSMTDPEFVFRFTEISKGSMTDPEFVFRLIEISKRMDGEKNLAAR